VVILRGVKIIKFNEVEPIFNEKFDTGNLRIGADYDIEVADDVFWVPVNRLGLSRYTKDDIINMLPLSPEEKQSKIGVLFEAIQLYQLSNFRSVFDNVKLMQNNLCWNYHKPGYHAVRTNEGCCASNSNWLSYLLNGKYEQMGFIHYSQRDSNGHIMNYIFHKGWYYFIDMMMYRIDSLPYAGIETGTQKGYKDNELIAGNFFKSRVPISYVKYCLQKHKDPPIIFTISLEKEIYTLGCDDISNSFDIIHPKQTNIVILYKENEFDNNLRFQEPLICDCKWESIPSENFNC
jgi:hypothetical protein